MKIAIILGTRPEIVKMSPVIRACINQGIEYFTLHTGQHYSYNLDRIFFEEMGIPEARYNLNCGSGTHAEETGKMIMGIEKILQKEFPDIILVQGDTNSVLAGAIAASKMKSKLGHVEAGLRSYDRSMPEEINRVLTDHISDYLFTPTEKASSNLMKEGISKSDIYNVGNTIVDAVRQNLKISERKGNILGKLGVTKKDYILVTSHRQENVDSKQKLVNIIKAMQMINEEYGLQIIYPIHPRTMKRIREFRLEFPRDMKLIEPLGFLDFLQLEAYSRIILTDSGGIQEESCILRVPCVTLRENTERPETLEIGCNILTGTDPEKIVKGFEVMMNRSTSWDNPFGDGMSGERIISIISNKYSN
jgi:UDP-N-acetylglucosamine 2-epimerase (non-hydrolysing)